MRHGMCVVALVLLTTTWAKPLGGGCQSVEDCSDTSLICATPLNHTSPVCSLCTSSSDCVAQYNNEQICTAQGTCNHKALIPISVTDGIATLLLFVGGTLAAGGGIGGGGIFVPLLILIGKFTTKGAIPLSNTLIAGASVANFIQMAGKRHPTGDRPLIDYNLALLLQPLTLGGTVIGVILNAMFPTWLLLALLVIVLVLTVLRSGKKAINLWREERKRAALALTEQLTRGLGELTWSTGSDDTGTGAATDPAHVHDEWVNDDAVMLAPTTTEFLPFHADTVARLASARASPSRRPARPSVDVEAAVEASDSERSAASTPPTRTRSPRCDADPGIVRTAKSYRERPNGRSQAPGSPLLSAVAPPGRGFQMSKSVPVISAGMGEPDGPFLALAAARRPRPSAGSSFFSTGNSSGDDHAGSDLSRAAAAAAAAEPARRESREAGPRRAGSTPLDSSSSKHTPRSNSNSNSKLARVEFTPDGGGGSGGARRAMGAVVVNDETPIQATVDAAGQGTAHTVRSGKSVGSGSAASTPRSATVSPASRVGSINAPEAARTGSAVKEKLASRTGSKVRPASGAFAKGLKSALVPAVSVGATGEATTALVGLLKIEQRTPLFKLGLLFCCLVFVAAVSLLKGSTSGQSLIHIVPCGTVYWLLTWLQFPVLLGLVLVVAVHLVRRHELKTRIAYTYLVGDVVWTRKRALLIALFSVIAGLFSSLLGLGGGMILAPMMIEIGVLPPVIAATSSVMIMFTSLSAVAQFLVLGSLPWQYSLWFAGIGLISSFVGQTGINYIVRRWRMQSAIMFLIVVVIMVATILLTITGVTNLVQQIKADSPTLNFEPLC